MTDTLKINFTVYPDHNRPFTADACFIQDGKPKPVVIFTHGFKGFKDWGHFNLMSGYFAEQGFVFVKFNFSHNGTSVDNFADLHDMEAFGQNNFSLELDDLKALIDLLHDENGPLPPAELDLSNLFLIGHSRGGGAVILKAVEDSRVKAVASWAGVSNYDQRWPESVMQHWKQEGVQWVVNGRTGQQMPLYYQVVENFLENKHRLDIPELIKKMQQPLLILHGENDETLPIQMAHQLKAGKPDADLHLLPGADHSFGGKHPYELADLPDAATVAANLTIDFFRKHA